MIRPIILCMVMIIYRIFRFIFKYMQSKVRIPLSPNNPKICSPCLIPLGTVLLNGPTRPEYPYLPYPFFSTLSRVDHTFL